MVRFITALGALGVLALMLPGADDEPKMLKPVNLPINTDKDEADPHVASSQLALFYAANLGKRWEIMSSTRKAASEPWSAGAPVADIKSKDADFRSPFLTTDGRYPQRFYYSSNMDPLTKGEKGDNYDVYFLTKFDAKAGFGSYNTLNPVCTERDETHIWLTIDEEKAYVSRKTEGGWRLFVSSRPKDGGQFGAPEQIKLPLGFHHATLTPDGKTMYVQGPVEAKGKGQRWGLFVTTSADGKSWSKPEPLVGLNSDKAPTGEISPSLSRDGSMLYFASDRPGGKGGLDVYAIATAELKKQ